MNSLIADKENIRIDIYINEKIEDLTRAKIQKLIENKKILVNNKPIKNSYKIQLNDIITIYPFEENYDIKSEEMPLNIVYEDDDILVINKDSGVVVHPSETKRSHTLVNGLMHYSKNLSKVNGKFRPGIVHRIDKDTSGLLIIAKNDKAHNILSKALEKKEIKREYIALVAGVINHDTGTIDAPIGRDKKDRKKMTVTSDNSKDAITHFEVIERYKKSCLIKCILETGRTHQIRVHMKYINHPIINDPVYYRKKINNFGQMLHAKKIIFNHPITKKHMEFECEPPKEFFDILEKYKNE